MLGQVQEMLRIEKGGPEQIADELAAYNPLIPQGHELTATMMVEIDDPIRRGNVLARLGFLEETAFFDLGGVKVELIAMGANHTRGDTAIWIDLDRVLFSGDVAMRPQPAFASPYSNVRHWLSSLDSLEALKPTIIVPSHGPVGDGSMFASGYRTYLVEVRDRTTTEKKAGRDADQAVEAVTAAMADRFPDKGRLAGAIKAAYAEAQ